MQNYIQRGDTVTLTTPVGGITSGSGVLVGSIFGVAAFAAEAGAEVEATTVGVFDLAKTTADSFAQGASVYWNATTKLATSTAEVNKLIGAALLVAANGDASVRTRLNGVSV